MWDENKGKIYGATATQVIKDNESKITRYKDRYKDLTSIS